MDFPAYFPLFRFSLSHPLTSIKKIFLWLSIIKKIFIRFSFSPCINFFHNHHHQRLYCLPACFYSLWKNLSFKYRCLLNFLPLFSLVPSSYHRFVYHYRLMKNNLITSKYCTLRAAGFACCYTVDDIQQMEIGLLLFPLTFRRLLLSSFFTFPNAGVPYLF